MVVDPCTPWHRSSRFARGQATPSIGRCSRCLHLLVGIDQDAGEHAQGHLRCGGEYLRVLDTQSVEGNQVEQKPAGGVWGCAAGREEVLIERILGCGIFHQVIMLLSLSM